MLAAPAIPATAEPQGAAPARTAPAEARADAPSSVKGKTLRFTYGQRAGVRCRELLPSGNPAPWGAWHALEGAAAYSYTFDARNSCTLTEPGNPPTRISAAYFKDGRGKATVQVAKQGADGGGQAEYRLTFTTPTSGVASCRIREMSRETEMTNIRFTLE